MSLEYESLVPCENDPRLVAMHTTKKTAVNGYCHRKKYLKCVKNPLRINS